MPSHICPYCGKNYKPLKTNITGVVACNKCRMAICLNKPRKATIKYL